MSIEPKTRFTGIFVPAEILDFRTPQGKRLSILEQMLLSWIDALYCEKRGGCFASNRHLGNRLDAKPNTIAKAITHLRTLHLIKDITPKGDSDRVIVALIGKFAHERAKLEAEKEARSIQGGLDCNPRGVGQKSIGGLDKNPNPSLYIESKDEIKEEREGATPPNPPRTLDSFKQRALHIKTTDEEHEKLAQSPYSPEKREKAYQFLSEWKQDTPPSKWKKSDYRSILRWVFKAIDEREGKYTPNAQKPDRTRKNTDGSTVAMPHIDNLF